MTGLGTTVAEFGTGLLRTRVGDLGAGRFAWERRAGPDRGAALRAPADAVRAALDAVDAGGVRLVAGQPWGDALVYPLPGALTAARLLYDPAPAVHALVGEALRGAGRALRELHLGPVPGGVPAGSPGVGRVTGRLDGRPGPLATARLTAAAHDRLGPVRVARVRAWADEAGDGNGPGVVLVHGAPSLGGLVPSPRPGVAGLISGEDVARAPAASDVGWLAGELVELGEAAARGLGTAPAVDVAALVGALLDGYGTDFDRAAAGRAAVVRILCHAGDFAAYVGWHDDLLAYLDIVAEQLDAGGAGL